MTHLDMIFRRSFYRFLWFFIILDDHMALFNMVGKISQTLRTLELLPLFANIANISFRNRSIYIVANLGFVIPVITLYIIIGKYLDKVMLQSGNKT